MLRFERVLITGANGTLGTELRLQLDQYKIPYVGTDMEVDVCDHSAFYKTLLRSHCDVVIHCAGIVDVPWCETNKDKAYQVNVDGTVNVARSCQELDRFMVHISSDYVFRGDKEYKGDGVEGNYEIYDRLDPVNYYAYTKILADIAVQNRLPHYSIVARISFKKKGPWPYPKAFIDQYTSRDTVDVIANQILQVTFGRRFGIVHLGTERKTVYELAKRQSPEVEPISINDIKNVVLPRDTSMKLTKVEKVL
jgi:dTDP-4-dehydrorhamnose reductase